jgi:hypothetical protein
MEREEVVVSGENEIGVAAYRQREKFVVVRVAADGDFDLRYDNLEKIDEVI